MSGRGRENGARGAGNRHEEYSRLIETEDAATADQIITHSPTRKPNGIHDSSDNLGPSGSDAHAPMAGRTREARRSISIPRRSLSRMTAASRIGTASGGEVLELHFASIEQKRIRWWKESAITSLFILSWFLFAIVLSVYNKWMFSPDKLGFPFPLFVTTLHMFVQWFLAFVVRRLWPQRFKPDTNPSKHDYATKAVPTAMATSLDIGLSNLSLKLITLSFYTMCKSSSLIFVLFFAFLLKLEVPSLRLILVITFIAVGVLLMVFTTTTFSLLGLILVLSASFLGGLRWGLTQILLKKRDMGMNNPAATIFWLAPSMGLTLMVVTAFVEGPIKIWNSDFWARVGLVQSLVYLTSPGAVAFAMVMSEYYIITRAGVVPLSIAGIFKEVTTLTVSAWVFGDHLTELNIIGVIITIGGIILYTYHKYTIALHSAVPLDAHGNPLQEEEAEEVLEVVRRNTILDGEEGVRLLEDGGELVVDVDEDDSDRAAAVAKLTNAGAHGDGEITGRAEEHPLFSVGEEDDLESPAPAVGGGNLRR